MLSYQKFIANPTMKVLKRNLFLSDEGINEKYALVDINHKFLQTFSNLLYWGDLVFCTLNEVIFVSLYSLTFDV